LEFNNFNSKIQAILMNEVIDLRFLLTIRESDSLLAASRKLGLTPSAVTQRLQQMERRLEEMR
jgi:DNA-binding transcriptional LysR family regulator